MVSEPNPGVLDFQDAVYGPITYDVVSLFRDAFMSWPEARVLDWTVRYWERAKKAGLPVDRRLRRRSTATFEWMGLQRHLKVLGIFARIHYRDGKPGYLDDTPRFCAYARAVASRYSRARQLTAAVRHARRARAASVLHVLSREADESDDPCGRPRRAHAPAHRQRRPSRCSKRAASRSSPGPSKRSPRRGVTRTRDQSRRISARSIERALGDGAALGRAHSLFARSRKARSRPPAASPMRCRSSGPRRSSS